MGSHLPYIWDYQIDENEFRTILSGEKKIGRLDRDWAAVRLLEYAPYRDITQKLGFPALADGWPHWRNKIRSQSRKRGLDFLMAWLPVQDKSLISSVSVSTSTEGIQNTDMSTLNRAHYFNQLYPLQDEVLQIISQIDTGFYLTGGTAASRCYLQHRFSDDLDFFVDDDERFQLWSQRIIQGLSQASDLASDLNSQFTIQVLMAEERFVRLNVIQETVTLKVEMINDVPARVGTPRTDAILGCFDTAENILANKITVLIGREEPKYLADIWGFCGKMGLSLTGAIEDAHSKAAGIFPADLARILCSANGSDWQLIRWIDAPPVNEFVGDLHQLGKELLLV